MENKKISYYGMGRRKTSVASVYLLNNSTQGLKTTFQVNESLGESYFQNNLHYLNQIQAPLFKLNLLSNYNIIAKVKGGGLKGQADAIKLALARAICKVEPQNFRPVLKAEGLLSRDSRIKERRKYGLKKARKASQYSKR